MRKFECLFVYTINHTVKVQDFFKFGNDYDPDCRFFIPVPGEQSREQTLVTSRLRTEISSQQLKIEIILSYRIRKCKVHVTWIRLFGNSVVCNADFHTAWRGFNPAITATATIIVRRGTAYCSLRFFSDYPLVTLSS